MGMYGVGNERICEISIDNVEPELVSVSDISRLTSLSWKDV